MSSIEEKLLQSLQQLQQDYKSQFSDLYTTINELTDKMNRRDREQGISIPATLREQERGKKCVTCQHAIYTTILTQDANKRINRATWNFECLISSTRYSVHHCTKYKKYQQIEFVEG